MASKKKEVSLQASITSEEQWSEMRATTGLTVVDVYQRWCGPCRAVVSLFRKIKNELADDLLHFATAEADSIEALKGYRDRCEPTFLFYGGGELVGVQRGADAPLLQKIIVELLCQEKRVLKEGLMHRVKDEGLTNEDKVANEIFLIPANKSHTVGIIKPDAVAHGKVNEIMMKIQDVGFEILAHEERTLTEDEARDFYQHKAAEAYFEDLVQFMSSGPSHILVVSCTEGSKDVIQAWREFIGPANVEEARRQRPESLRALYGSAALQNGLHGSEDSERASRELAFFFPSFREAAAASEPDEAEREPAERTLALIRPDVARENREKILSRIHEAGFTVALQKEVMLTEQQVRSFYCSHEEENYFPALLRSMTSGPVLALALARRDAVHHWRSLLGPKDISRALQEQPDSLRAQFRLEGEAINQLHGSGTDEEAKHEIDFFFPHEETLAVIKPDAMGEHKAEVEAGGFTVTQMKEMVLSREMAEQFYKEHQSKPFFNQLVDFMCRGPCLMLILSKVNAVEEWRAMMGPTDPAEARNMAANSLRARFAKDILQNSVHGSSDCQHARDKIHLIFGEVDPETGADSQAEMSSSTEGRKHQD
uniref:Thioredoxin domain-containing protein n=1 Tax=Denticeps clupeoides TaxID=299321 RepID=A0AAY4DUQ8_9TELE